MLFWFVRVEHILTTALSVTLLAWVFSFLISRSANEKKFFGFSSLSLLVSEWTTWFNCTNCWFFWCLTRMSKKNLQDNWTCPKEKKTWRITLKRAFQTITRDGFSHGRLKSWYNLYIYMYVFNIEYTSYNSLTQTLSPTDWFSGTNRCNIISAPLWKTLSLMFALIKLQQFVK